MRSSARACLLALSLAMLASVRTVNTAPARRPLGADERNAVLALIKAVDLAQTADADADAGLGWSSHVLKSGDHTAYVPFTLTLNNAAAGFKATAIYVRAVSRRGGVRVSEERSSLRDWLLHGGSGVAPRMAETVFVAPGEMPVGGPAAGSSRQSVSGPATASTALALQQRAFEKQKQAEEEARKKGETNERDPFLFPFEEYYFLDLKSPRGGAGGRSLERALALPPGEYDVYVALIDRARLKVSSPVVLRRTVTVPDFWADQLALSSLILAKDVRVLKVPLTGQQQAERPYAFGLSEIVPALAASFTTDEALTVVFQMSNYGAPDADLSAEYLFYRVDGARRLFNRTDPQQFGDEDLPPVRAWETAAFAMQAVSLQPFPPGQYELEVTVRDRLTRAIAKATVAFTVSSGLR